MTIKQHEQLIYDTAKSCGLNDVQAKIIIAQAKHESGIFSSNVFFTDNSYFGMKYPSVRSKKYIEKKSTLVMRSEGSQPYAHYSSFENSVKDLILGYHVNFKTDWSKINSVASYEAQLVKNGYHGQDTGLYTKALNNYYAALGNIKDSPNSKYLAIALGAAVLLYILT